VSAWSFSFTGERALLSIQACRMAEMEAAKVKGILPAQTGLTIVRAAGERLVADMRVGTADGRGRAPTARRSAERSARWAVLRP
jgi:hypothetical protein